MEVTDRVAEKIIEILKENGSLNMSELYRELNREGKCSRGKLYDAIRELEEKSVVRTVLHKGRRIVTLRQTVPLYLKVLTGFTLVSLILFYLETPLNNKLVVNLSSDVSAMVVYPSFSIILLSMLSGFWVAVLILRQSDVIEALYTLKRCMMPVLSRIENLKIYFQK